MGTPSDFEIILGDDIIELVRNECQTTAEVESALLAVMPPADTQHLPTPPPSPPPSDKQVKLQTHYQSLRWPKRLKMPLAIWVSASSGFSTPHAPLETLPYDILWTILSQPSAVANQTLLNQDDHVSLILTSKTMAANYLEAHSRPTTILERRELLIFDRIATSIPRRINAPFSLKLSLEQQAEKLDRAPEGSSHPNKSKLKRAKDEENEDDAKVPGKDDQTEETSCRKRRKLVGF